MSAHDPLVGRLFAALPHIRTYSEELYGPWDGEDPGSISVFEGAVGGWLDDRLGTSSEPESDDDLLRTFAFLEELTASGNREARGMVNWAVHVITPPNLEAAHSLMGEATRGILEEQAAWTEWWRPYAARYAEEKDGWDWALANVDAWLTACRRIKR